MYLPIQTSPVVFLFVLTDPNQDIFGVFRSQAVDAALRIHAGYFIFYHQTLFYPLLLLLSTGKHPKQYMFLTIHGVHCIKRYGRLRRQQNTSEFGAFAGGHTTKNNYF